MLRVLTTIGHYLPGFKGGGPVRSVSNLTAQLGDKFSFFLLTSDRDLGESHPYSHIPCGTWQHLNKTQVLYLPPNQMRVGFLKQFLTTFNYDVLYLNGFFGVITQRILMLRYLHLIPEKPIIVAPRGEFSPGALAIKSYKKYAYLWLVGRIGLCRGVLWHATSDREKGDLLPRFGRSSNAVSPAIMVAANLSGHFDQVASLRVRDTYPKNSGAARIVFLSRITRKKNLIYALELLAKSRVAITFDIYGPIEDRDYWGKCKSLIRQIPSNVFVSYKGEVPPDRVHEVLSQYHLLLFPTWGENFGHVILEALCAGCLVLVSDQTPWRQLESRKVGWDIPLEDPESFQLALNQLILMGNEEFGEWSRAAGRMGLDVVLDPIALEANRQLFLAAKH